MRSQYLAVALAACVVGSASIIGASSARAVDGPPTVTVTPSTELTDNQVVQVSGSGIPVTGGLNLIECAGQSTQPTACNGVTLVTTAALEPVTVGDDGTFTTSIPLRRNIVVFGGTPTIPTANFSCAFGCSLNLFRITGPTVSDWTFIAGAPISFVRPHLAVSIATQAALDVSRNLVTGWATVTCDKETPVSVAANIGEEGEANGEHTFISGGVGLHLVCVPGDPLLVYLTTHDAQGADVHYSVGTASASICVVPQVSFASCDETADPDVVQTTSTVQIADAATVGQSVSEMLADPANTAFRAEFAKALRAALDEDPIFRAEFVAELQGH